MANTQRPALRRGSVIGNDLVGFDTKEDQHQQNDGQHLDQQLGQRQVRRAVEDKEERNGDADHAQADDGAQP